MCCFELKWLSPKKKKKKIHSNLMPPLFWTKMQFLTHLPYFSLSDAWPLV